VRRAEQYLKAFAGKRLAEHSVQDVTGYLEGVGRIGRIEDWQFAQVVDAVENLLLTAGAPIARELDWAYWRDSARTLASDHPTIARDGVGRSANGGTAVAFRPTGAGEPLGRNRENGDKTSDGAGHHACGTESKTGQAECGLR
jgi:hypothetical protein